MKLTNLLFALIITSPFANAALPANQIQALHEQVYSRLNAPAPALEETMSLLTKIVAEVDQRMETIRVAAKAEMTRSTREMALFQQKVKTPYNPLQNAEFKKAVGAQCVRVCCEELAARRKSRGG